MNTNQQEDQNPISSQEKDNKAPKIEEKNPQGLVSSPPATNPTLPSNQNKENNSENLLKENYTIDDYSESSYSGSLNPSTHNAINQNALEASTSHNMFQGNNLHSNINHQNGKYNNKYNITSKDKELFDFITAIKNDNIEEVIKLFNSSKSHGLLNRVSPEGMLPIHYAVLFSSVKSFHFLYEKKAIVDKEIEGFPLLHLSLMNSIFLKSREQVKEIFTFIFKNLDNQRNIVDRLGRTYLHIIIEYDFDDVLDDIDVNINELFVKDNNNEYAMNYFYLYRSYRTFFKISKDQNFLKELYENVRLKFEETKSDGILGKEKFLEMCFLYQNYDIIVFLILNSENFYNILEEDLKNLLEFYKNMQFSKSFKDTKGRENNISNESKESNLNLKALAGFGSTNDSNNDVDEDAKTKIIGNIDYALDYLKNHKNKKGYKFPFLINNKTGIVYNKNCIKHIQLPENGLKHMLKRNEMFENSDRLNCLINEENGVMLNDAIFNHNLEKEHSRSCFYFKETDRKAFLSDILRCHDISYIKSLKIKCESLKEEEDNQYIEKDLNNLDNNINKDIIDNSSNNNYNNVSNTNNNDQVNNSGNNSSLPLQSSPNLPSNHKDYKIPDTFFNYTKIDCDTYINPYTYDNIFNTAGCVFDAIDLVMQGKVKNAFALIRPPGHHAGYYGPVENPIIDSAGFCIINNVAIGAAYTKYKYEDSIKRIAIFDFDVHHGNGTEEIIKMLSGKTFNRNFTIDKNSTFNYTNEKQINWLDESDAENILFISTHIYNENNPKSFYPYTGSVSENTPKESKIYPGGIKNISFPCKANFPYEYRNILRTKVFPRIEKFKPDIIFLSAGFDGHELEIINKHHMLLRECDFAYLTMQMQLLAHKVCNDRLVSILEGGYNVTTGLASSFAQSAFVHARWMNIGINIFHCFDIKLTGVKRKLEMDNEIKNYMLLNRSKNKPRRSERIKHLEDDKKKDEFYKNLNKDFNKDIDMNENKAATAVNDLSSNKILDENQDSNGCDKSINNTKHKKKNFKSKKVPKNAKGSKSNKTNLNNNANENELDNLGILDIDNDNDNEEEEMNDTNMNNLGHYFNGHALENSSNKNNLNHVQVNVNNIFKNDSKEHINEIEDDFTKIENVFKK